MKTCVVRLIYGICILGADVTTTTITIKTNTKEGRFLGSAAVGVSVCAGRTLRYLILRACAVPGEEESEAFRVVLIDADRRLDAMEVGVLSVR